MTTELVRKEPSSLTTLTEEEQPSIFWKFRQIFEADWCTDRKIYWYDVRFNRTRLWQITQLNRVSKKQDKLLGIFPGEPDVDVLKLAIAGANIERILTGVRWEIYSDFACNQLVTMGRFDVIDLVPADRSKLEQLFRSNHVGVKSSIKDWDFDGIFRTHICPKCQKAYSQDLLMFIPDWMHCSSCGFSLSKDSGAFSALLKNLLVQLARSNEFRFPVEDKTNIPVAIQLIDVLPTPLIAHIIGELLGGAPLSHSYGMGLGMEPNDLITCLEMSLFHKIRIPIIRDGFIDFVSVFFDEQIAHYQNGGSLPKMPMPEMTESQHREYLTKNWSETKQHFVDQTMLLSSLSDWFLGRKVTKAEEFQNTGAFKKALHGYAYNLETLIELLWQEKMEASHE
ncbi:hypothetical protein HN858_01545 [Candidatus Falkowbacteria bacterium]|jgi:hypothetical protein|nr:hypothetical protein [Candidatus Falkowbacteria bacterium]MBT5503786.1 hypothetical protein [Candidatus Falkowbacteria bacterium]MBT6573926.1 hypothetical protein [Candidatus Falkowbacteria bacterium]MBT7348337.1 hypothetical protein [Candidatus Falkowbacteria bacterium]MBT7500280.1 hypothetical protein [Candidatus Falkowbacteria bacterium]